MGCNHGEAKDDGKGQERIGIEVGAEITEVATGIGAVEGLIIGADTGNADDEPSTDSDESTVVGAGSAETDATTPRWSPSTVQESSPSLPLPLLSKLSLALPLLPSPPLLLPPLPLPLPLTLVSSRL